MHSDETSDICNQKANVYPCQHCKNLAHSVIRVTRVWGGWWSSKSSPGHLVLTFTAAVYTRRATVSLAESVTNNSQPLTHCGMTVPSLANLSHSGSAINRADDKAEGAFVPGLHQLSSA